MGLLNPNAELLMATVSFFDYDLKMWHNHLWVIASPSHPEWILIGETPYWLVKAETISPLTNMPVIIKTKLMKTDDDSPQNLKNRLSSATWTEELDFQHMNTYQELQQIQRRAQITKEIMRLKSNPALDQS